jgi:hypothetical protein
LKKQKAVVSAITSPFDSIRKIEAGREYWSARDLQKLLGYREWRKFEDAIERAMIACKNSGHIPDEQFVPAANLLKRGKYATQEQKDYRMSRYACYLVAMNSDPRKQEVSDAQTYFAVQTRVAETSGRLPLLNSLWEERLELFHKHTKIPDGYWCIFGMVAAYCRSDEFRNVHLVENALPDGSVGKHWCEFLREQGYDTATLKKYPHRFPDKRGVQMANIYPNELLGTFWTWFNVTYLKENYPLYLKGRLASDGMLQIHSSDRTNA